MRGKLIIGVMLVLAGFAALLKSGRLFGPPRDQASAAFSAAPDFSLPQLNGEPLQLSAYRGKVVLLDFWATWCEPCRVEIPHLVELQNKYQDQGLQIIGVSMDDGPEPVRQFYQNFKMNYPVVMGNADVGKSYGGVLGLPIAFLIDRNGRIEKKLIGATDAATMEQTVHALIQSVGK